MCANNCNFHLVKGSGALKLKLTLPSLSVCNCGKKKAVSWRFFRILTGFKISKSFLVVITITPFFPFSPYIAMASTFFRTLISKISFAFRLLKLSSLTSLPSITNNASVFPFIDSTPLSCTNELSPDSVSSEAISKPGT